MRDRFLAKVSPCPITGCWWWAASAKSRYGSFAVHHRENRSAHRASWELFRGEIPDGLSVLHRCDQPFCVNPDHLFLGTNAENVADRHGKGRDARGDRAGPSKLTEEQVRAIRARCRVDRGLARKPAPDSYSAIAREYGVSYVAVRKIVRGESWAHLSGVGDSP